jgi:FHA domain-containing protein
MSILRDFERRLEGLVEGLFAKTFRGGLQPVELAKRILRDMDAAKTVGVRDVWAPNHFTFTLSPADAERFEQAEGALIQELQQVVRDHATERGWGLVGPPEVVFETDEALGKGRFRSVARLAEGEEQIPPSTETPIAPGGSAADASLLIPSEGRTVRIRREAVTIGRLPECDVVVSDPGASRRHAQIRHQNGSYLITDLGSTNGTLVNGLPVHSHELHEGDHITIGNTVLEFRRS